MGEELKEWQWMWGAKVKLRNDMPDDMLKDAIETVRRKYNKFLFGYYYKIFTVPSLT